MSSAELPLGAQNLVEQIDLFLNDPNFESTEYAEVQRSMRAVALLKQSAETLKWIQQRAEQPEDAPRERSVRVNELENLVCVDCGRTLIANFYVHKDCPNRVKQALRPVSDEMVERAIQTFHRRTGAPCVSTIDEFRHFRAALEAAINGE